jgi:hypothetical protein
MSRPGCPAGARSPCFFEGLVIGMGIECVRLMLYSSRSLNVALFVLGVALTAAGCATTSEYSLLDVVGANVFLVPEEAVPVVLRAIARDPERAPEIAATAARVAPNQAEAIAMAAGHVAPHRASWIRRAVAEAIASPPDTSVSTLPEVVAAPPRRQVVADQSPFARAFIGSWGPENMYRPRWRNDTPGAGAPIEGSPR